MPLCMFNHPLLFAAVAVVAIGVVIYELMSAQEEEGYRTRPPSDSRRPPKPPPPNSRPPRPPSDDRRKPPRPPSPDSRPPRPPSDDHPKPPPAPESPRQPNSRLPKGNEAPSYSVVPIVPGNNLRKRNINKTSFSENASENSKNETKVSSEIDEKRAIETSANSDNCPDKRFDENNYCKNMFDKLTNDTKNINENIRSERNLDHNIYEEESDSSENNFPTKSEEKLINQTTADEKICNSNKPKRKRKSKHPTQKRHTNNNTTDQSGKSQSYNIYPEIESISNSLLNSESETTESSSSLDEDAFKREMLEVFRNDVHNSNENNPDNSMCSSEEIKQEELPEFELCKACEEKHINTRAYPCGHSYLCAVCAIRLFRLSKKCSICLRDVIEFVQFAS